MKDLSRAAIQAAMQNKWELAVKLNKQLLSLQPKNISALNRLAFAQLQKGSYIEAISTYKKILRLNPIHPLAEKNLQKAQILAAKHPQLSHHQTISASGQLSSPDTFVNEPGTTGQIPLVNTATQTMLETLFVGQQVQLKYTRKTVEVRTLDAEEKYIGALPDNVSFHLRHLTKRGNQYSVHIKRIDACRVYVFIKETKRGKSVKEPTFHSRIILP